MRADRPDGVADGFSHVRAEIVENDGVSQLQGRTQFGLDIEAEEFAVDRSVEHPGRGDAVILSQAACSPAMARGL